MALEATLTDGTKNVKLVYEAGVQESYKLRAGASVRSGESIADWHQADGYPRELVNLHDDIRVAHLEMHIVDGDDDTVLNAVTTLKRWVDGANQQAARYWLRGDVDRINLKLKLKNATNGTIHPVLFGHVDDGAAFYSHVAYKNEIAYGVVVTLYLAPYGEAESDIDLQSDLENGAFLRESSTSGLAANWALISTPTQTLDADIKLIGSQSQKVVASSANEGIQSDTFTGFSSVALYVWVHVTSGNVSVLLRDTSAASVVDSAILDASDSNSVSDKTHVDEGGRTWYRVPITAGTITSGNDHRIRVFASGAAATFYVDGAWMEGDTTTVPDAWCSYTSILNRGDWDTSNTTQINYVDVWGVPGDAPALGTLDVDPTSAVEFFLIARRHDGVQPYNYAPSWLEDADFSDGATTHWSSQSDAARTDGTYMRFTAGTAEQIQAALFGTGGTDPTPREKAVALYALPFRVFAIAKTSHSSGQIKAEIDLPFTSTTDYVSFERTAVWELIDLGLFNYAGTIANSSVGGGTGYSANIGIYASADAAETVDVDAIIILPASENDFLITGSDTDTYSIIRVNGTRQLVEDTNGSSVDSLGSLWTIESEKAQRIFFALYDIGTDAAIDITDDASVTVTVTPRTRHLLGTI